MDELDHLVSVFAGWREQGHRVAIATVIKTWGSAPRRRGSHLLIRDDGLFEGSVSGGCVETDVIRNARALIDGGGGSGILNYRVSQNEAWEVGLACGGEVSILVQSIDEEHFPPALFRSIQAVRKAGTPLVISTDLELGRSRVEEEVDAEAFTNWYLPPLRLALIGAVDIAQKLVPIARAAGHAPTVIDPRSAFSMAGRFDLEVDRDWPDEALTRWSPDAGCAVVALTHDPKLDDAAIKVALRSPAYYIAALGSRRTQEARLVRLRAEGLTETELRRIRGPAGLDIGAEGPTEIAISIMGELISALRGKT